MSDPFVAEIRMFAGNFAPKGWALCNGQLLPISQNTALFSLLGTFYGGDGKSTFALPNLQGATPIGQGQSSTGTQYFLGESAGSEFVTLIQSEIPAHTHQVGANTDDLADIQDPGPQVTLGSAQGLTPYFSGNQNTNLNFQALSVAGSSFPHNNMMPYLTVTFIIALQGVFPPRG
ncbi:MAG: tail fiber protein [Acidobacteriota bacterium]|nr:tail fiber protein [Acidobacteriota bacterium]